MDLLIKLDNNILRVRVAILVKTENGYLFEKNKEYIFPIGGKIKLNESSLEAAQREIKEELDIEIDIENFVFKSILENFYTDKNNIKVHEICFIYEVKEILSLNLPDNFVAVPVNEIDNFNIKPKIIVDLIKNNSSGSLVLNS
ncbi:NUDIX domain-containing protein [Candidatus Nomurabacteria bacterium]|nr:NUDIX domain-containing protein [Candidatus Nomurabacteria bacterium]